MQAGQIGATPRLVLADETEASFGISTEEIDEAIQTLEAAFSASIEEIFRDSTIEPNFAALRFAMPQSSSLARSGFAWYDGQEVVNIGPDAPGLTSPDHFWAAFRNLGFNEFDRFGGVITQP